MIDTVIHSMIEATVDIQMTTETTIKTVGSHNTTTTKEETITEIGPISITPMIIEETKIILEVLKGTQTGEAKDKFTIMMFSQVEEIPIMKMIIIGKKTIIRMDTIIDQTWNTNT